MKQKTDNKIEGFEYVLFELIQWFKDSHAISDQVFFEKNNFNKLKVIKLHFFVVAINSSSNSLLEFFDNFYALPLGHVESDILSSWSQLKKYSVDHNGLKFKSGSAPTISDFESFPQPKKEEIKKAIERLKLVNVALVDYNALELVELSHQWSSWLSTIQFARSIGKNSYKIPTNLIKNEVKSFKLA